MTGIIPVRLYSVSKRIPSILPPKDRVNQHTNILTIYIYQYMQSTLRKFMTPNNVQSGVFWGTTAAATALWMTQPFEYIKSLFDKTEAEHQES